MVNLLKYSVAPETGCVDMVLHYFVHGKEITEPQSFVNQQNAKSYFYNTQRTVFLSNLDTYVSFQKSIIDTQDQRFNMAKHEALALANNFLDWASGVKTEMAPGIDALCKYGVKMEKYLQKMLPPEDHPEYMRSRDLLASIILFCKTWQEIQDPFTPKI